MNGAKGHSALQLSRDLDCQYKTAFVLSHKIREALAAEQAASKRYSGCNHYQLLAAEQIGRDLLAIVDFAQSVMGLDTSSIRKVAVGWTDAPSTVQSLNTAAESALSSISTAENSLASAKQAFERFKHLRAFIVARFSENEYEISLPSYSYWFGSLPSSRHALLYTTLTAFSTKGWFRLWVEKGERKTITTVDGFVQDWPTFKEVPAWEGEAAREAVADAKRELRTAKREFDAARRNVKKVTRGLCRDLNAGIPRIARAIRGVRW